MDRRKFIRRSALSAGIILTGGVIVANVQRPVGRGRSNDGGCRDFKDNDKDGYCDKSSTCRKRCNKKAPEEESQKEESQKDK